MLNNKKKCIRISGEVLDIVREVVNSTNRNLTGAVTYLILNGYQEYLREADVLKTLKSKNHMSKSWKDGE